MLAFVADPFKEFLTRMDVKGWGMDQTGPMREARTSSKDAFDAFKGQYDDMMSWGKDPVTGGSSPLRDAADRAGGYPATGLRGGAAGVKESDSSTEPEE